MSTTLLLGILVFGTLGAVSVFGYLSARNSGKRLHANTVKSTLAEDAPNDAERGQRPPDT